MLFKNPKITSLLKIDNPFEKLRLLFPVKIKTEQKQDHKKELAEVPNKSFRGNTAAQAQNSELVSCLKFILNTACYN